MTDTSPSPFRRFPWAQLAFCLACLAMTAWTWMRYSYCWQATPREIVAAEPGTILWDSGYVRLSCLQEEHAVFREGCGFEVHDPDVPDVVFPICLSEMDTYERAVCLPEYPPDEPFDAPREWDTSGTVPAVHIGRIQAYYDGPGFLLAGASRFHPASVAGIVVGAMGCFIFGLYLKRWLRERKAA